MRAARKQRVYLVLFIVLGVSIAMALMLYALSNNINFFISPTQVHNGKAPMHHTFRLGGLVEPGTVHYHKNGLVTFMITDKLNQIKVDYHGVLPDLFKAGRAVVTQGHLQNSNLFIADQVLAKHDNRYMPRQVKQELQHAALLKKQGYSRT